MSTPMLTGVGDPYVKTTQLTDGTIGEEVIKPLNLFEFNFNSDVTRLEAKAFRGGVLKTAASTRGETTNTLTITSQYVNFAEMGFYLNQFAETDASVDIPVLKTATVPTGTPEIVDAGITAATEAGIYVYVYDDDDSSYRQIVDAAPSAGEVQVDDTNTKLVFNAADAGKTISYTLPVNKTNKQFYGGIRSTTADSYGTVEFWGTMYPNNATVYFPSLDFSTAPSFDFTGDVGVLSVGFSANTPTGWSDPFKIFKAD